VQVVVMPITDRTREYAQTIADKLDELGFRVETDFRSEKIGFKIREAQMQKVPYMLVLGDKESESGLVTVRERLSGDIGEMSLDSFITRISEEISKKQ
jgi:threonyl-tRNA synthetase